MVFKLKAAQTPLPNCNLRRHLVYQRDDTPGPRVPIPQHSPVSQEDGVQSMFMDDAKFQKLLWRGKTLN